MRKSLVLTFAVLILGVSAADADISGLITDQVGNPIQGAVVQAWDDYPTGQVVATSSSGADGAYTLAVADGRYDIRVYAPDLKFYPEVREGVLSPSENIDFALRPVPSVAETASVCDFWGQATFGGVPLQEGDIVTAVDPDGVICGVVWRVQQGYYAVHVYGDDPTTAEDEGAETGDTITFLINGVRAAVVSGDPTWEDKGSKEVSLSAERRAIRIEQPPDRYVTDLTSIRVRGNATPRDLVSVTVNRIQAEVDAEGNFTASDVPLQNEGENRITAEATYADGAVISTSITVIRDTTPPQIQITSPTDGLITDQTSIAVTGTVSDANLDKVYVNDQEVPVTDGTFTATVNLTVEGPNTITARATDVVGHEATASVTVIRDTTPPQIRITSPADGSWVNQGTITVTGTVSDANLDKVYVNDREIPVTDGSFSTTVSLAEGENVITAKATDLAGNEATMSVTVTLDTIPPQIQIISPTDGTWINRDVITVTGTVSDANLDRVEVNGVSAVVSDGTFSAEIQLLNKGDNLVTARAFDKAGNSAEHVITVKRDTAKPTLANPSVSPAVVRNGDQITLEVDASDDGSGIASVTADIDALDTAAAQTTVQLNPLQGQPGKYSAAYTISQNNTAPNGQYTITFTATDVAGNASDPVTATVTLRNLLITLQTDETALIPNGQSKATLIATVTDASGAGLEGETVKFSFDPRSEQLGQLGDVEDKGNGVYRCIYTSPELSVEETPKTVSFIATVKGKTVDDVTSNSVSITLGFITMKITVQPDTLTACGTQTATVTVTLSDNNGPIEGETIQFSTDNGSISPETATTDKNGICTVTYTAGTK
ncbi:hypothetical protein DRP77_07390, partial [Candidatus Poribacteria bacterium]